MKVDKEILSTYIITTVNFITIQLEKKIEPLNIKMTFLILIYIYIFYNKKN